MRREEVHPADPRLNTVRTGARKGRGRPRGARTRGGLTTREETPSRRTASRKDAVPAGAAGNCSSRCRRTGTIPGNLSPEKWAEARTRGRGGEAGNQRMDQEEAAGEHATTGAIYPNNCRASDQRPETPWRRARRPKNRDLPVTRSRRRGPGRRGGVASYESRGWCGHSDRGTNWRAVGAAKSCSRTVPRSPGPQPRDSLRHQEPSDFPKAAVGVKVLPERRDAPL
ncbi:hypothetical protein NDU88_001444 [Pleurodeles waltl]|uniref:Uncharacterized protein n=1 Tax=Pleurodeles waltl TaxID=8319 RepID=A0AAV7VWH6_PLEWA|nr:hypothetical protein NDU88_001444 [Pleurodeles waltl]